MSAFLRAFFFLHMSPVIRIGRKRTITESDLLPLPEALDPEQGAERVSRLARATRGRPVRFLVSLYASEKRFMAVSFFYAALGALATLGSAALVHAFLSSLARAASSPKFPWDTFGLGFAFTAMGFCVLMFPQQAFYASFQAYLRIAGKLNVAIYRRTLQLPLAARQQRGVGDTVNLMSADSDAVGDSANVLPELFSDALVIVGAFAMLGWLLGPAVFAAMACFAVLIPIQRRIAGRFVTLDHALLAARDERVERVSQILRGIRVVKFFGWRASAEAEVSALRERELRERGRLVWAEGASAFVFLLSSAVVTVVTFFVHLRSGGALTPAVAFASMALFVSLEEPLSEFSFMMANFVGARVSAARIAGFLLEDPLPAIGAAGSAVTIVSEHGKHAPAVEFEGVGVRFGDKADGAHALAGVRLSVKPGEAIAIVGPVGAGKTTLLRALLGETPVHEGNVRIAVGAPGLHVGYVPQEAFVLNASVRENILLGAPEARLASVVHDCVLGPDLAAFPSGVSTEIGEQGVNLSGGQKQRLNLARAAARDANLVLLDDPLSAVDERTERLLCDRLLFGRWCAATRIVTTHRLSSIARFDRVVYLVEGRVIDAGSHDALLARCELYRAFVQRSAQEAHTPQVDECGSGFAPVLPLAPVSEAARANDRGLTGEERMERGAVVAGTYRRFLSALGGGDARAWIRLTRLAGVTLLAFAVPFLQRAWLSAWTEIESARAGSGMGVEAVQSTGHAHVFLERLLGAFVRADALENLFVFAGLGVIGFCVVFAERVAWLGSGITGGRVIHSAALQGVLNAPLRFFDSNPQGRILNRFSRDMDGVDRALPWAVSNAGRSFASGVATLAVVLALFPLLALLAIPVGLLFLRVQADYRASAREIKRVDSRARSPVFAHYKETLSGLVEIRAHGAQRAFFDAFLSRLRESVRLSLNGVSVNRWFAVRIPLITVVVSAGLTLFLSYASWKGSIGPGLAGLVLTYANLLWFALSMGVRSFAEIESRMTGVERLFEYGDTAPEADITEQPALAEEMLWPTRGGIEFDRVSVRYAEGEPDILSDVTLSIPAGSKVGVVGRTGAGKSTLFQTLFRFLEPSRGEVRIDGVPLGAVPLDRLRQALAIIPQDPVLFAGSLRENLDRFGRHDDLSLWLALEAAHLKELVASLPGGLSFALAENGGNLSQGQRQMICLARALLIGAKVILLDEATASVDVRTDALMQETLRKHCRMATVLVIAHRLETLEDCDVIVELAEGRVVRVEQRRKRGVEVERWNDASRLYALELKETGGDSVAW